MLRAPDSWLSSGHNYVRNGGESPTRSLFTAKDYDKLPEQVGTGARGDMPGGLLPGPTSPFTSPTANPAYSRQTPSSRLDRLSRTSSLSPGMSRHGPMKVKSPYVTESRSDTNLGHRGIVGGVGGKGSVRPMTHGSSTKDVSRLSPVPYGTRSQHTDKGGKAKRTGFKSRLVDIEVQLHEAMRGLDLVPNQDRTEQVCTLLAEMHTMVDPLLHPILTKLQDEVLKSIYGPYFTLDRTDDIAHQSSAGHTSIQYDRLPYFEAVRGLEREKYEWKEREAELRGHIHTLESKVAELVASKDLLQGMLDARASEDRYYETQIADRDADITKLKFKLHQMTVHHQKFERLLEEETALRKQNISKADYQSALDERDKYKEDLQSTQNMLFETMEELSIYKHEKGDLVARQALAVAESKLESIQGDRDVVGYNLQQANETISKMRDQLRVYKLVADAGTPRPLWRRDVSMVLPEFAQVEDRVRTTRDRTQWMVGRIQYLSQENTRLTSEVKDLTNKNADLRSHLRVNTEQELADAPEVEEMYDALGTGDDVRPWLRFTGSLRKRNWSSKDTEKLIYNYWIEKEKFDRKRGDISSFEDYLFTYLRAKYGQQAQVAEAGYNLLDACSKYRWNTDIRVFDDLLNGLYSQNIKTGLDRHLEVVMEHFKRMDREEGGTLSGTVSRKKLIPKFKVMFKHRNESELLALNVALGKDQDKKMIVYEELFGLDKEGAPGHFVECVRSQWLDNFVRLVEDFTQGIDVWKDHTNNTISVQNLSKVAHVVSPAWKHGEVRNLVARVFTIPLPMVDKQPKRTMDVSVCIDVLKASHFKRGGPEPPRPLVFDNSTDGSGLKKIVRHSTMMTLPELKPSIADNKQHAMSTSKMETSTAPEGAPKGYTRTRRGAMAIPMHGSYSSPGQARMHASIRTTTDQQTKERQEHATRVREDLASSIAAAEGAGLVRTRKRVAMSGMDQ